MEGESGRNRVVILTGSEDVNIDDQGRILIPKRLREQLGADFTIAPGDDGGIYLWPENYWYAKFEPFVKSDPANPAMSDPSNPGRSKYLALLTKDAVGNSNCDSSGRLTLPKRLMTMAKISAKEKVSLVCEFDHIAIRSRDEVVDRYGDSDNKFYKLQERLSAARREMLEPVK